jgi:transcriptional regulator with XRE-family HTH domain
MDVDEIKNRILTFLRTENISSAQFAQEIGVQPSGISHIISGRNKPSLEFIVKMLTRYPSLSSDWLLFGNGPIFREGKSIDLFSTKQDILTSDREIFTDNYQPESKKSESREDKANAETTEQPHGALSRGKSRRIIIFNEDGTFSEHFPE